MNWISICSMLVVFSEVKIFIFDNYISSWQVTLSAFLFIIQNFNITLSYNENGQ